MSNLKILVGNDRPDQGILWKNTFNSLGASAISAKPNGVSLLYYAKENPMLDIIIIEAKMQGLDAIEFIKELKKLGERPIIIVTSECEMPFFEENVMFHGAKAFLVKPFDTNTLLKSIVETNDQSDKTEINLEDAFKNIIDWQEIECIVTDALRQIWIPDDSNGFYFLKYAIMLSVKNAEIVRCITKLLYPIVAAKFNTTSSRAEFNIRCAIKLFWNNGNPDVLNSYFGYNIKNTVTPPTNSEFITYVSDKLRQQIKKDGYTVRL